VLFPHYCTKCKRATRTLKWRIVGDATSSAPATGVSLFPRLSRCAAVLYWLHAFRVTKVVDTWKLLRTNVGHTLALERDRRSSLRDRSPDDDINEERTTQHVAANANQGMSGKMQARTMIEPLPELGYNDGNVDCRFARVETFLVGEASIASSRASCLRQLRLEGSSIRVRSRSRDRVVSDRRGIAPVVSSGKNLSLSLSLPFFL